MFRGRALFDSIDLGNGSDVYSYIIVCSHVLDDSFSSTSLIWVYILTYSCLDVSTKVTVVVNLSGE